VQIKLRSDFRDYYDHWFARWDAPDCPSFDRWSRTAMTRLEQFELLDKANLDVPVFGRVGDAEFMEWWYDSTNVKRLSQVKAVVYLDELAHRGEGKRLVTLDEAFSHYKDFPYSSFIPTTENPEQDAISYRYLQVGDRAWWLRYRGKGSWLSNYACETEIKVLSEVFGFWEEGERTRIFGAYPLFAIDFVTWQGMERKKAIDFNSAPGLRGTGIEDILSAKECFQAIATWLILHC
jgi:hypothetical protein